MSRRSAQRLALAVLVAVSPLGYGGQDGPDATAATTDSLEGLGPHRRKVSTRSPEAQAYFDRGLAYLYAFNHDEAIRSFDDAAAADPACVAAHWGKALALGPHVNFPLMPEEKNREALGALRRAQAWIGHASPLERELVQALAKRYDADPPEDRKALDVAYAEAMREVWRRNPNDADVGALFAEALMDVWPWDLWSGSGEPRPDTAEVLATIDSVLAMAPTHPLALHLHVHALEASPHPERAADSADRLRTLAPRLGHLVHMPSHIDVRLGRWQRAIEANHRAIEADAAYADQAAEQDFYRIYMAHNRHMLAYAATMRGQSSLATEQIDAMVDEMPADWLEKNALFVDGMRTMPYELHLRFGRWDQMLAEPQPPGFLPICRAFRLYARGVAHAAQGDVARGRVEQQAYRAAVAALPEEAMFVQNPAAEVLAVADRLLEGELLYREGAVDRAVEALEQGVRLEDALRYIEPPDWIQPVRHVLGATLIDARRFDAAEAVYRADLVRNPHNGWSLRGLAQCLRAQGDGTEAAEVEARFRKAWRDADVRLTSSCLCLPAQN
ncbi:MAG: hypothetical protein ACRCT8_14700 [Lacipirellulaceae bacterium]